MKRVVDKTAEKVYNFVNIFGEIQCRGKFLMKKNLWGIGVVNVLLIIALGVVLIAGAAVAQGKDKNQSLFTAVTFHDPSKAKQLIEDGADIEAKDDLGLTCLVIACSKGNLEIVKLLLEKGAKVNAPAADGTTPLMAVAGSGSVYSVEIAQRLLEKGADVAARNKDGKTAINFANDKADKKLAEFLVQHGTKK
jgi:ankyrin repeat protein